MRYYGNKSEYLVEDNFKKLEYELSLYSINNFLTDLKFTDGEKYTIHEFADYKISHIKQFYIKKNMPINDILNPISKPGLRKIDSIEYQVQSLHSLDFFKTKSIDSKFYDYVIKADNLLLDDVQLTEDNLILKLTALNQELKTIRDNSYENMISIDFYITQIINELSKINTNIKITQWPTLILLLDDILGNCDFIKCKYISHRSILYADDYNYNRLNMYPILIKLLMYNNAVDTIIEKSDKYYFAELYKSVESMSNVINYPEFIAIVDQIKLTSANYRIKYSDSEKNRIIALMKVSNLKSIATQITEYYRLSIGDLFQLQ